MEEEEEEPLKSGQQGAPCIRADIDVGCDTLDQLVSQAVRS
jgi:hypothetical protein